MSKTYESDFALMLCGLYLEGMFFWFELWKFRELKSRQLLNLQGLLQTKKCLQK
ncbi:MAG: hypothetical protein ACJAWV_001599 [Flammeovirgaceae bacterium]|jgi:hypothetical protein